MQPYNNKKNYFCKHFFPCKMVYYKTCTKIYNKKICRRPWSAGRSRSWHTQRWRRWRWRWWWWWWWQGERGWGLVLPLQNWCQVGSFSSVFLFALCYEHFPLSPCKTRTFSPFSWTPYTLVPPYLLGIWDCTIFSFYYYLFVLIYRLFIFFKTKFL